MAKYITLACGHREELPPRSLTSDEIERRQQRLCADCYRDERRQSHDEENHRAAEAAQDAGLPELEGTERQIAWATTIRDNALQMIDECIALLAGVTDRVEMAWAPQLAAARAWLVERRSASFWIEARGSLPSPHPAMPASKSLVISIFYGLRNLPDRRDRRALVEVLDQARSQAAEAQG